MEDLEDSRWIEELTAAESSTRADLRSRVRLGAIVAVALSVLTGLEYLVAIGINDPLVWLVPFGIAKAVLILEYFMHFSSVISRGAH